ncbi:MAG TPA: DUF6765 family protein, partial [Thermoanaerobaculia bacterium]|nr:DUF6765 family protein [Thermoanaerobaculia bacterium]
MRTRSIVGLSLLLLVAPLQAWERDVHYDLTFWLARHAGFSDAHSEAIAKADQGLDDSAFTSAVGLMAHIAVSGEEASAIQVQKYHFPSDAAIPSPPEARAVEPNSKAARLEAVNATAATDAANALQRFGQALHPFQDSWSHAGVPDSPFRPGPRINERLSFGHPAGRGGWPRHDADLAHLHPKDVTEMARATYDLMLAFLQNNPRYRDHAATATADLDGPLAAFLLARTKQAKVAWVTKFGKGNLSTDVLTLAGVRKATRHVRTVKRRNADLGSRPAVQVATLGGAAIAVDQEEPPVPGQLVERAHELLRKWFDERNPAAALEFVDVRAVGRQFEGYPPPLGGPEPVHEVNL